MTPEAVTWTISNFGELVEGFEVDNGLLVTQEQILWGVCCNIENQK